MGGAFFLKWRCNGRLCVCSHPETQHDLTRDAVKRGACSLVDADTEAMRKCPCPVFTHALSTWTRQQLVTLPAGQEPQ